MNEIKDSYLALNADAESTYKKLVSSKVSWKGKRPVERSELTELIQRLMEIDAQFSSCVNLSGARVDNQAVMYKLEIVALARTLAFDTISKIEQALSGLESGHNFLVSVLLSLIAIGVTLFIALFG